MLKKIDEQLPLLVMLSDLVCWRPDTRERIGSDGSRCRTLFQTQSIGMCGVQQARDHYMQQVPEHGAMPFSSILHKVPYLTTKLPKSASHAESHVLVSGSVIAMQGILTFFRLGGAE